MVYSKSSTRKGLFIASRANEIVDVTPAELESFNRYKAKVNKRPVKYSTKKKLGLPDAPTHGVTTSEFHQIIPRYKLKQMEEAGRLKN